MSLTKDRKRTVPQVGGHDSDEELNVDIRPDRPPLLVGTYKTVDWCLNPDCKTRTSIVTVQPVLTSSDGRISMPYDPFSKFMDEDMDLSRVRLTIECADPKCTRREGRSKYTKDLPNSLCPDCEIICNTVSSYACFEAENSIAVKEGMVKFFRDDDLEALCIKKGADSPQYRRKRHDVIFNACFHCRTVRVSMVTCYAVDCYMPMMFQCDEKGGKKDRYRCPLSHEQGHSGDLIMRKEPWSGAADVAQDVTIARAYNMKCPRCLHGYPAIVNNLSQSQSQWIKPSYICTNTRCQLIWQLI